MLDFEKPICTEEKALWQRPKTTRRYLHPPRSERMFTMWTEGKWILGENERGKDFTSYPDLTSWGIWLVHTKWLVQNKNIRKFDFRKTEHLTTPGGAPIHGMRNGFGGIAVETESFCNDKRKCTMFSRIKVKNTSPYTAAGRLGLAVREGKEEELIYGSPDEYVPYDPELAAFLNVPATFRYENGILSRNDVFVSVSSSLELTFDEANGILWALISLEPGEEREITFSFGKGEVFDFSYEEEKAKTALFWEKELSRIKVSCRKEMICQLTAQILQSFCYYLDENDLVLRQGGLQRLMWPWEAMPALEALGRIGEFSDYIEEALSFYFDKMQQPDGEVKTVGEGWASVTASCLYSLAVYCSQKGDKAYFDSYRDKAFLTFDWIKNKRKESAKIEGAVPGLFPPMRGSDWPQLFQHWTNTDVFALFSLQALAKTAEQFGDERWEEVKAECENYLARLTELFDAFAAKYEGKDELRVPLTPNGDDSAFLNNYYPYLLQGAFVRSGAVKKEDVDRILSYHKRVGLYKNGLHSRMPYRDGDPHIFYVVNGDYHWFYTYLRLGRIEEARQVLDATVKYAMTEEYYMIERYSEDDPYYVPWSPNVSASGRLINMLLDFSVGETESTLV